MSYVCTTCDEKLATVPDGAVQITSGHGRRVTSYRFPDGSMHHLRNDHGRGNLAKSLHTRWHKTKKKPECIFCFPPPESEPPVQVEVEVELPEP
jgi:hypothetical protein